MKKTEQQTSAIVSFNDKVLELPTLLELDDMDLDEVSGGNRDPKAECWINCWINYADPH